MALLREWTVGFCPLNAIERGLSDLIDARQSHPVQRTAAVVTAEDAMAMLEPGDVLIDCTGSKSLLRDQLVPGSGATDGSANTFNIRLEYALVVTFLYGQAYDCNEFCKYYKNIENAHYKIPRRRFGQGSPYFQSISLGSECAMFLAGLLAQRDLAVSDMFRSL